MKIVVIGGGTGTYTVLTGLKKFRGVELTAIVSMMDSGGSSGRLRDEFGHLPPGDVRQCLVALSEEDLILRQLFNFRFEKNSSLNGHSFGNLFLTALTEITGGTEKAIEEAAKILTVKGRVLPVTLTNTELCAKLVDGTIIRGETNIDVRKIKPEIKIDHVYLDPKASVYLPVLQSIKEANILVIGPGDLYSSIIPNLLVSGVSEAIKSSRAKKVYVANLMTKHGESDHFKASDFIKEVLKYLGDGAKIDYAIVNKGRTNKIQMENYQKENAFLVEYDEEECQRLVKKVISRSLVSSGKLFRHDPEKLAKSILGI
ncbi:MAG: YvcK family protein [Patescibacteria group bacterium]|nr:YvcK family protein [Patescibacteria group bacterium]